MSFGNTVGKGDFAPNEQFLLFPECLHAFQRTLTFLSSLYKHLKFIIWEMVKASFTIIIGFALSLAQDQPAQNVQADLKSTLYYAFPKEEGFGKKYGKRRNAGYQHFLLFLQYFQPFPKQISLFQSISLLSTNDFNLDFRNSNKLYCSGII